MTGAGLGLAVGAGVPAGGVGDGTMLPPQAAAVRARTTAPARNDLGWRTPNLRADARRPCASSGARRRLRAGAADRAAERASNDVDNLLNVAVGLAALRGGPDAALDVILEDEHGQ